MLVSIVPVFPFQFRVTLRVFSDARRRGPADGDDTASAGQREAVAAILRSVSDLCVASTELVRQGPVHQRSLLPGRFAC